MEFISYIAHPIQGLIKYHGIKDWNERIPYHDSISVCIDAMYTKVTVTFDDYKDKLFFVSNDIKEANIKEQKGIINMLNHIRELSNKKRFVKIFVQNFIDNKPVDLYEIGKGLGFSASIGASLAACLCELYELHDILEDKTELSKIARKFSSSAARSVTGGFSKLIVNNEESYSVLLADKNEIFDFCMIIYPIKERLGLKTDNAHLDSITSPIFNLRKEIINKLIKEMEEAIRNKDIEKISYLAEFDSLFLHAVTETGNKHLIYREPESLVLYKALYKMRNYEVIPEKVKEKGGFPAWISWDTGPSSFINLNRKLVDEFLTKLNNEIKLLNYEIKLPKPIISKVGGGVSKTDKHIVF